MFRVGPPSGPSNSVEKQSSKETITVRRIIVRRKFVGVSPHFPMQHVHICQTKPTFGDGAPPHSHSILSMHRNALIYKRKIFLLTVKARPSSRQNISLMISKENSRVSDSATFQGLSTTIGRFFYAIDFVARHAPIKGKTVSIHSTARSCPLCSLPLAASTPLIELDGKRASE